jgi:phosphomannomutase
MKYFGTDGIRGIPGDSLPYHLCKKLGNSLSKLNVKNLIMAEDTRESSALIRSHLIEGITMAGINVTFLGIISTPELIYYSKLINNEISLNRMKEITKNLAEINMEDIFKELNNNDKNNIKAKRIK